MEKVQKELEANGKRMREFKKQIEAYYTREQIIELFDSRLAALR